MSDKLMVAIMLVCFAINAGVLGFILGHRVASRARNNHKHGDSK